MKIPFGGSSPYLVPPSRLSSLALGIYSQATFLTATGLTYSRAATAVQTLQTSATTRLDGISGSANIAMIGDAGYGRGAVSEGGSTNYLATVVADTRDLTSAGWAFTAGTRTYINAVNAAGPNAAGDYAESRIVIAGSQSVHAQSGGGGFLGAGKPVCASAWFASPLNGAASPISAVFGDAGFTNAALYAVGSAIQPWQRGTIKIIETAAAQIFYPCNSFTTVPEDLLVDACQVDSVGFALEYKPGVGAGAARTGDTYAYAGGSVLATGSFSPWLQFIPKNATTADETPPVAQSTTYTLWSFFGGFIRINNTTFRVEIQVNGGAVATSGVSIAFVRGDVIQIFASIGNGLPSVLKYRRNGGAAIDLVMATSFPAISSAVGDLYVFGAGGVLDNVWCWAQDCALYKPGFRPAGF